MKQILQAVTHRPWPLPAGKCVMAQQWHDLLFAHWPIALEILQPNIPSDLEIDTFDGQAWLGVVPFRMQGVRLRYAPEVPGTSRFPELNVRTYVKQDGKPGVWFFSLDADNALAVAVARAWFHLPYLRARMRCEERSGWIDYRSERVQRSDHPTRRVAKYRGVGKTFRAEIGTFEHFLIERYCQYASKPRGEVVRGEIHHPPWDLQLAEAEFTENSMANLFLAKWPIPTLLHFSKRQDVVAWAPEIV